MFARLLLSRDSLHLMISVRYIFWIDGGNPPVETQISPFFFHDLLIFSQISKAQKKSEQIAAGGKNWFQE